MDSSSGNGHAGITDMSPSPTTKRPHEHDDTQSSISSQISKRIKIDSVQLSLESDPFDDNENLFRDTPFDDPFISNGGVVVDDKAEVHSDHSHTSDDFYSKIIAMEEKAQSMSGAMTPSIDLKNVTRAKVTEESRLTLSSGTTTSDDSTEIKPPVVKVSMSVKNPLTNKVVMDTTTFTADVDSVLAFLKVNNLEVSLTESGYLGDISKEVPSSGPSALRLSKSSLGSTIPRPSDASTLRRPSDSLDESRISRSRSYRSTLLLLSSTRISEENGDIAELSSGREVGKDITTPVTGKRTEDISSPAAVQSSMSAEMNISCGSSIQVLTDGDTTRKSKGKKGKSERKGGNASMDAVDKFQDPGFIKSATLWAGVGPGAVVFARWRDRCYYSGKVEKHGANDTWAINFEDGMADVASEAHILPIKILGVGCWTIYCPGEECKLENCRVAGQRFVDGVSDDLTKTEYALISDKDGRVIVCNRKNLALGENDAREMRKHHQVKITPKTADVSAGNIVQGKRNRSATTQPTPSSQIRKLVAELESKSSDITCTFVGKRNLEKVSTTTPTTSRKQSQGTKRKNIKGQEPSSAEGWVTSCDTESQLSPEPPRKLSMADTDSSSGKEDEPENAQLFPGKLFFLTATGGMDPASPTGYDKDDLRNMIESGGGTVLDDVGSEGRRRKNLFLISDNYARTVKYIYALAAGIPCVSFKWIRESFLKQCLLDYKPYELNAGLSIESDEVLPSHREKPLKGFQVYVTGATDELYKYWKPVLTAAGAIIRKKNVKKGQPDAPIPSQTDVMVTDNPCIFEVWDFAREMEIPIVKPEWLVQTIITGKKVAYNGHDKYTVDELAE